MDDSFMFTPGKSCDRREQLIGSGILWKDVPTLTGYTGAAVRDSLWCRVSGQESDKKPRGESYRQPHLLCAHAGN